MVMKIKKVKGTKNMPQKIQVESYKNCLKANHLENKINHLEKKIEVDHGDFIKKQFTTKQ